MAQSNKNKQQGELIFGAHSVLELLQQKRRKVIAIYTTKPEPKIWASVEAFKPSYPINIQYVTRDILTRMAGTTDHQGILAWAQPFPLRTRIFTPDKQPFIVLLDGIQDPRNMGAIIRSAYCTGVDGVVIVQQQSAPLSGTVHKASAGLAERCQIYCASSTPVAVQEIKKAGYALYLATFDGSDATTIEYKKPLCLVIGAEGTGVARSILSLGQHITLTQAAADVSYNASVAAGILMFTITNALKKQ